MSKLRIGVLGLHHDHVWDHLPELAAHPEIELAGVADPNPPLLEKAMPYGCPTYRKYDDLMEKEAPDAVFVFASNRTGAELAVSALNRGIHVMIEKPMAADLAGAEAMRVAAEANGVRLMINWPFAWWRQLQKAIALASAGEIGRLWQVKYRAAHQGPREMGCTPFFCEWLYDEYLNGGGALMDYCCYGAVLANVLLGCPETVTGVQGRFCKEDIEVEDNAILVMKYPRGMATSEASWTQIGKLTAYATAIYGQSGTLLVEPRDGGRLLKATPEYEEGEEIEVGEPEAHLRSATAHFHWGLVTGAAFHPLCDPVQGRDAQAILEAGRRSAEEGVEVSIEI